MVHSVGLIKDMIISGCIVWLKKIAYSLEGLNIFGRMLLEVCFKGLGSENVNSVYVARCID